METESKVENKQKKERELKITRSEVDRFKEKFKKFESSITFSLLITLSLHIAKIAIGSVYLEKCPLQPKIPIYLIAAGVVGVVTKILALFKKILEDRLNISNLLWYWIVLGVLATLEIALCICGSVWVYSIYKPNFDSKFAPFYCDYTPYMFAFVVITLFYAFILLFIFIGFCALLSCCIFVAAQLKKVEDSIEENEGENKEKKEVKKKENDV